MAARASMASLIADLRQRCEAGTADYSLAGVTFWDDEALQARLDAYRTDVYRAPLVVQPVYSGGSALYYDYYWQRGAAVEAVDGGTAWRVEDSAGSAVGTADYEVNADARHIRFDSDQQAKAYYLTYRVFDMDRAEADVWDRKAAHYAAAYDVSTDNTSLKRSQLIAHCRAMADAARKRAPARNRASVRFDVGEGF